MDSCLPETKIQRIEAEEIKHVNYEYLDHTADVQLHSWGKSLNEAIVNCVIAMYGYMTTDLSSVVDELYSMDFYATGSDFCSLVYNLLDTCLYHFSAEPFFIGRKCCVLSFKDGSESLKDDDKNLENHKFMKGGEDEENSEEGKTSKYFIHIRAWGESFDLVKHSGGTEIKAITYSNLQVLEPLTNASNANINSFDAANVEDVTEEIGEQKSSAGELYEKHDSEFNIFVIVDI